MSKITRILALIIGALLGLPVSNIILSSTTIMRFLPIHNTILINTIVMVALGIIFYILYPLIINLLRRITKQLEKVTRTVNLYQLSFQIIGLIIGLILAALISSAFNSYPDTSIRWIITIVIYVLMGYIGFTLPRYFQDEIKRSISKIPIPFKENNKESKNLLKRSKKKENTTAKILDTSVLIDGRILDIFKTHFLEGPLYIPTYVLNELQVVSDSANDLKRYKGRRGLDIVAQLEKLYPNDVKIIEEDFSDLNDVDSKLIRSAKTHNYKIITNDYNLNKLASVQGIAILNINDLANAVKIIVLPGESINVSPIKEGKEPGQAVAYLDDGTMIVVESGQNLIGKNKDVIVTSVLQTSAGRMIFAKPKGVY